MKGMASCPEAPLQFFYVDGASVRLDVETADLFPGSPSSTEPEHKL